MAKNNNLTDFLTDIANTIRTKKGTTGAINPQNFSSEIESIETGVDNPLIANNDAEMNTYLNDTKYLNMYVKFTGQSETYVTGETYKIVEEDADPTQYEPVGSKSDIKLNIAYGNTTPTDTSKLWVKTTEPNAVTVSASPFGNGDLQMGISQLPTAAYSIGVGVVGTKIYLFGGRRSGGKLNTINCFIVSLPLTNNTLLIQESLTDNLFKLIVSDNINVGIGVISVYKGNSNNQGELVEALIYKNGAWVSI